ncbi:aspartate kinase [Microthyrium microscopicum]|uniref:Aspartokinase n=1 Tax=Microthyrium microscopicum TaxID=703497 RepID=A0A6A6UFE7_9PEZI|nr:aspartate kinase [Microthyrium microscopicum]
MHRQEDWIVQKYGGTSLGKLLDSICGEIIPSFWARNNVAVVCSAISGKTKNSGTTSLLLQCIELISSTSLASQIQMNNVFDVLKDHHFSILENLASKSTEASAKETLQAACLTVSKECEQIRAFMIAAQTVGELSPRAKDRILALGERLACIIVAAALQVKGIPAQAVFLDNLVEEAFGSSVSNQRYAIEQLGSEVYPLLAQQIALKIEQCDGRLPVLTGFFGIMPDSLMKAVGRGYSDFCAALCALGLRAHELQIWKEVDGIYTSDPRKIPSARLLPAVTVEEAAELTYYGSEVVHPLAVDQIRHAGIRLQLKNVFNPSGAGTRIYPTRSTSSSPELSPAPTRPASPPSQAFLLSNGYHGKHQNRRVPTAVTAKEPITVLNVLCNQKRKFSIFLVSVLEQFTKHKLNIDLVTSSERSISVALENIDSPERLQRLIGDLETFGTVNVSDERAIISVVGHKMKNMVGVSSEIFDALAEAKINIYMISQGASEINISVVVRKDQALLATSVIHENVLKIPSKSEMENNFIKGPWLY